MVEEQLLSLTRPSSEQPPGFPISDCWKLVPLLCDPPSVAAGCRSPLTLHGRTRTGTPVDIESPSLESWIVESWLVMVETGVLLDAFTQVYESLHRILADLTAADYSGAEKP